ncbi:MAG: molybdopterin/thiamine biosynthesis adenylyltransferase/rhodanese-related sulfurtransferase [Lentisphaeria bacterium]|jgi:molybdopterin/thiamine biosynthesis adenylyltransferase/rhodanese-related sulfurtransferase
MYPMPATTFSPAEWLRYTRHIQLPNFGVEGQTALKNAHVLIVGMGGLGSPVALYLAAAGVGKMTIVDGDIVDLTNLQRQIIFTMDDIGEVKASAAKMRLLALNPNIHVNVFGQHFDRTLAAELPDKYDLVLDCTDNFLARYTINDFCLVKKLPWLFASVYHYAGQCALFIPEGPCFRCLFSNTPSETDDCNNAGVIGVLPGMLGLFQANEAIKFLAGLDTPLKNHLMLFDAQNLFMQRIELSIDKQCLCQTKEFDSDNVAEIPAPPRVKKAIESGHISMSPLEFNSLRDHEGTTLIDVRTLAERQGFHIGGIHIPANEIPERLAEFDHSHSYLCYCQSGFRSASAADFLNKNNVKAISLDGGLVAWIRDLKAPH